MKRRDDGRTSGRARLRVLDTSPAPASEVQRLSARLAELESEKAALEAFVGMAAHELVEPLVIAEAYAEMVSERLDDELHADSQRDLEALSRSAARTRRLLVTLLQDARSAHCGLDRERVELGPLVADCVGHISLQLAQRGVTISVGELPAVHGDATLLGSLFTNLLMNALKYSPRNRAAISVDAVAEGGSWRVSIQSGGPTIPAADRERIFAPYQRGSGERRARGAGLGLAICRRIVERHGGRIGVDPVAGGGNRFFFTLPA